jgi:hypothetical protein
VVEPTGPPRNLQSGAAGRAGKTTNRYPFPPPIRLRWCTGLARARSSVPPRCGRALLRIADQGTGHGSWVHHGVGRRVPSWSPGRRGPGGAPGAAVGPGPSPRGLATLDHWGPAPQGPPGPTRPRSSRPHGFSVRSGGPRPSRPIQRFASAPREDWQPSRGTLGRRQLRS